MGQKLESNSFLDPASIELVHFEICSRLPRFTLYVAGQLSFPLREVGIEIRIRESVKVALGQPGVQCGDHE